ncbi:VIT1/CCC1 transporter family protein [Clostridium sp. C8-1-8]|uniref:VIT1/CCC1 transporter family protein n=1 Tax=Clostridium sp. C8-1-8 TaxID=2698831 RepID=UPI00136F466B|nr:VIT1/CCC1 transporter family protein [Clostridium sp. C8-1-8]
MAINDRLLKVLKALQKSELTEKLIYINIAKYIKDDKNRQTLLRIAEEEQKHYDIWKKYSKVDVEPSKLQIFFYTCLAKIFGYTFVIKKMENSLNKSLYNDSADDELKELVPEIETIQKAELVHEQKMIELLDEERLQYVGSMVLGLNDALVEFTGSLAGYSFAMQSNKLISLAGLITGISATLSMTSSEFLSARSEGDKNAKKSAFYTGIAYLLTVVILILPYLLLPDNMYSLSLMIMLVLVIMIIAAFNYYISVAKNLSFKKRFAEMSLISLSVAAVSFVIGLLVKKFLGIDV